MIRLLTIAVFLPFIGFSQSINNVRAIFEDGKITVTYDLTGGLEMQGYNISLYSSHDNYSRPLLSVTGDVGSNEKPGVAKKIVWDAKVDLGEYKGALTFRVSADPIPFPYSFIKPSTATSYRRGKDAIVHWEGGNPYNFPISWSDVLAQNNNPVGVSGLYTYNPSSVSFNKDVAVLQPWEGGFVLADQAINLNIPVTVKRTAGRKGNNEIESGGLDKPEWFLPIVLSQGVAQNDLGGIGMHPAASQSKDRFDAHSLPRFVNYLELNSYHDDYFINKFTRDVVPTHSSHNWDLIVESNFEGPETVITWDNAALGINPAKLLLVDLADNHIVDMKQHSSYRFPSSSRRPFRILFGIDEHHLSPTMTTLGRAWPNPSAAEVTIPFLSDGSRYIHISVFDLMGKRVRSITSENLPMGYHEVVWDGTDEQGGRVAQGVYLYQLSSIGMPVQFGRMVIR